MSAILDRLYNGHDQDSETTSSAESQMYSEQKLAKMKEQLKSEVGANVGKHCN